MQKTALITGITGQDGSYLAEFLLDKGYSVFGFERRASIKRRDNIEGILDKIHIVSGDLLDYHSLVQSIQEARCDEVYNLASQSFVGESWRQPSYTGQVTGLGVTNILEAIRTVNPGIKFYQASSSEMFGKVCEVPQTESTPFYPRSPYGVAKLYGHWMTVNYRESYGIFTCSGILFNHESPRRGLEFVTRKISYGVAQIWAGYPYVLELGNLDAKRDWGYAADYVKAMWLMLQQDEPDDYVIATGKSHSVREFLETAFEAASIAVERNAEGDADGEYVKKETGRVVVKVNHSYFRPAEVDRLVGDTTKAQKKLGWRPEVSFEKLVETMVREDIKKVK